MRSTAFLCVLLAAASLATGETPVDSEQQCTVFKRIFSYDKHLRESEKIIVLIVGRTTDDIEVTSVADAFRAQGMFPVNVTVGSLNDDLTATLSAQSTVVYVMPDVNHSVVDTFATSRGYLSISGQPSLAESGQVSVSVDMASGRPQIVVNMPRLSAEGHEFSSELLRLARVIR